MRPCLERMIVTTAWVQAMDEDKTNEPSLSKRFHVSELSMHTQPCAIQEERTPPAGRETHTPPYPRLCLESCLAIGMQRQKPSLTILDTQALP